GLSPKCTPRGDVDDSSVTLLRHGARRAIGKVGGGREVGRQRALPRRGPIRVVRGERRVKRIDARVVDHRIDRLMPRSLVPEMLYRVRIAEVGLDEAVAAALES